MSYDFPHFIEAYGEEKKRWYIKWILYPFVGIALFFLLGILLTAVNIGLDSMFGGHTYYF